MLNGYVNENGNKINRSNWDKANFLEQHTFFCIFLYRCVARLETFQLHILWRKCRMCSRKILLPLFLLFCLFSLKLIFTLLAAHCQRLVFFHTLTAAMKFFLFLRTKFVYFVFILLLQLCLVIYVSEDIKIQSKRTRICCCFFLLKVRVAITILPNEQRKLNISIFCYFRLLRYSNLCTQCRFTV